MPDTATNAPRSAGARFFMRMHDYWIAPYRTERVRHYTIRAPEFTRTPMRVVVLSDFHSGKPFMPKHRLQRIVKRAMELAPDIILLPGDFFAEHRGGQVPLPETDLLHALAPLSAPLGVYAVLGNHDWWEDADAQKRRAGPVAFAHLLEAHGIRVLENAHITLDHHGVNFDLVGLGCQMALKDTRPRRHEHVGVDDLEAALSGCVPERFTLLLAHEPDIFPQAASHPVGVNVTVVGHTHAGQVQVFGQPIIVPSRYGRRFAQGRTDLDGAALIVSSGLGCSRLPVRFGVIPEITVITIGDNGSR